MENSTETVHGPAGRPKPPRQFAQLGVLVVDGSGSMTEPAAGGLTKAQATNNCIRELFTRFKKSRVANNFIFSVVNFDETADVRLSPTDVGDDLDDNDNYDPTSGHGGGTRIYSALEEAEKVVERFLASAPDGGVPHSAVILVMSDGVCSDPARTRDIANRIKNGRNHDRITIASAYFSTVGTNDQDGPSLLRDIASDPVLGYKTVYDSESLREFFTRSISAASKSVKID